MSIFQTVLSCLGLLPGSPATSVGSTTRISPAFGLRGHNANHFALPGAPLPGSLVSSRPYPTVFDYFEKRYGLRMLITKSIGLPVPLGLTSPLATIAFRTPSPAAQGSLNPRTPSPLQSTFPETPENGERIQPYPIGFARATPPKIHWNPAATSPVLHHEALSPNPIFPSLPALGQTTTGAVDYSDPVAMYVSALEETFGRPAPRMNTIIIPSLEDIVDGCSSTYVDAGLRSTLLSPTDTEPICSRKASKVVGRTRTSPTNAGSTASSEPGAGDGAAGSVAENVDDGGDKLPSHDLPVKRQKRQKCEQPEEDDDDDDDEYDDEHLTSRHPDGTAYRVLGTLGEGGYGRVMLAGTSKGEFVALKVLYKPMMYRSGLTKANLYNERDIMVMITEHGAPSLMHIKAAWEQNDNVYIAMELCPEDLRSRMKRAVRTGKAIPPSEVKLLCAEMLLALEDLDELRIVHGDIKPGNFLVTRSGRVVLSDFGLAQSAQILDADHDFGVPFWEWDAPDAMGTPGYYSPEALRRCEGENIPFTSKADVFSLGLIFVELFCGLKAPLWDPLEEPEGLDIDPEAWRLMGKAKRQAARMMTEGLCPVLEGDAIQDAGARNLVAQMLRADPRERPTVHELLRHPYFWDLNIEAVRAGYIPHDYEPCFFQQMDSALPNIAFLTWAYRKDKCMAWRRLAEEKGPLDKFTWPEPT